MYTVPNGRYCKHYNSVFIMESWKKKDWSKYTGTFVNVNCTFLIICQQQQGPEAIASRDQLWCCRILWTVIVPVKVRYEALVSRGRKYLRFISISHQPSRRSRPYLGLLLSPQGPLSDSYKFGEMSDGCYISLVLQSQRSYDLEI